MLLVSMSLAALLAADDAMSPIVLPAVVLLSVGEVMVGPLLLSRVAGDVGPRLHTLAVAIASSCSEWELVNSGGRVGSTLYALSREPVRAAAVSHGARKPITLSTKPLSTFAPVVDDELDDEDVSDRVTA